jgi:hypothetical protein
MISDMVKTETFRHEQDLGLSTWRELRDFDMGKIEDLQLGENGEISTWAN